TAGEKPPRRTGAIPRSKTSPNSSSISRRMRSKLANRSRSGGTSRRLPATQPGGPSPDGQRSVHPALVVAGQRADHGVLARGELERRLLGRARRDVGELPDARALVDLVTRLREVRRVGVGLEQHQLVGGAAAVG